LNLNMVVGSQIPAVNPDMLVTVQLNIGNTMNADGSVTPNYAPPVEVMAQVQPLTAGELRHMDMLNLSGTYRAIYTNGPLRGAVRPSLRGGDRVTLADGSVYLVTQTLENWFETAGFTKCAMTLQNNS
jgi:hypothetical protein